MGFVVPENAVTHFHLREGDRVGDFGAGSGHFIRPLSKAVGSEGRVFAIDIQKQLVENIANMARSEHLKNVEVLWGDIEAEGGIKLTDGTLDAGMLSNTLFQIEDKQTSLSEMARVLRKGGKFFVIDWTESFNHMGPEPDAIVSEEDVKNLLIECGFSFERTFEAGEHHYGLAFRRT